MERAGYEPMTAEPSLLDRLRSLDKEATWYVNVNDLIGGYSVGTVEAKASENLRSGDIAEMLTLEDAEQIADSHNALPEIIEAFELLDYIVYSALGSGLPPDEHARVTALLSKVSGT